MRPQKVHDETWIAWNLEKKKATKAFYKGRNAFWKNQSNPHKEGTFEHKEFERGYNSSYFENIERLNGREQTDSTVGRKSRI